METKQHVDKFAEILEQEHKERVENIKITKTAKELITELWG